MNELAEKLNISPELIIKECNQDESNEYKLKWKKSFCQNKQGANIKSYLWHIFSAHKYHSVCKKEARNEYQAHKASEYVIMSNEHELAIISSKKPENTGYKDFYVFPINLAWTMAFTHEDDFLGPFFAKNKHYDVLDSANNRQYELEKKKKLEIETARQKGWL